MSTSILSPAPAGARRPAWFGVWRFPAWIASPVFRSVERLGIRLGPVPVWIVLGAGRRGPAGAVRLLSAMADGLGDDDR